MILIVTPNPLLELRFSSGQFIPGAVNRNTGFAYQAGGKGFNVSRQLKQLGIKSTNCSFTGGNTGKQFRDSLALEGLDCVMVRTQADTRVASIHIENEKRQVTSLFSMNAAISEEEAHEMVARLEKMIMNCEIVVFAGSSPCPDADAIFIEGLRLANSFDKVSVLDTYGSHFSECLKHSPTVVHTNMQEIERSLGIEMKSGSDAEKYLDTMYTAGVKQVFLTDGGNSFYAANHDFHYRVTPPRVQVFDATGSGDAFVAGIVRGWFEDRVFEESVRFAAALGAENASSPNVCCVRPETAFARVAEVVIEPVGKRMKTIDVSPTV